MIAYWDAGMHNRFANRAALEEFGTYPVPVRLAYQRAAQRNRYAASKPYYDLALVGAPQRFERTDQNPKGQPRHSIVSYLPDADARGVVTGLFVEVTDITERKRMENELFDEKRARAPDAASHWRRSGLLGREGHSDLPQPRGRAPDGLAGL